MMVAKPKENVDLVEVAGQDRKSSKIKVREKKTKKPAVSLAARPTP